eukprot:TRINITY_DN19175_c0_g1_i1.p1 TRINITY_DN19175_c0_g1~~TRINITY_DN19175_c0_g1_i1.p1  ORF type:complete len:1074 (-),score=245.73 TRINITY_DN19175_c0_g1_i1:408-3629(-)
MMYSARQQSSPRRPASRGPRGVDAGVAGLRVRGTPPGYPAACSPERRHVQFDMQPRRNESDSDELALTLQLAAQKPALLDKSPCEGSAWLAIVRKELGELDERISRHLCRIQSQSDRVLEVVVKSLEGKVADVMAKQPVTEWRLTELAASVKGVQEHLEVQVQRSDAADSRFQKWRVSVEGDLRNRFAQQRQELRELLDQKKLSQRPEEQQSLDGSDGLKRAVLARLGTADEAEHVDRVAGGQKFEAFAESWRQELHAALDATKTRHDQLEALTTSRLAIRAEPQSQEWKQRCDHLETMMISCRQMLEASLVSFEERVSAAEKDATKLQIFENLIGDLKAKHLLTDTSVITLQTMKDSMDKLQERVIAAEAGMNDFQERVPAAEACMGKLEIVIASMDSLKEKIAAAETGMSKLQVCAASVDDLQCRVAAAETSVGNLQTFQVSVADLREKIAAAETGIHELQRLRASSDDLHLRLAAAENSVNSFQTVHALVDEVQNKVAAADTGMSELQAYAASVDHLQERVAAAETTLSNLQMIQVSIAGFQEKVAAVETDIHELQPWRASSDDLHMRLAAAENKVKGLQTLHASIGEVQDKAAAAESGLSELQACAASVDKLQDRVAAAETSISVMRQAAAENRENGLQMQTALIDTIQERVSAVEAGMSKLQMLEASMDDVQGRIATSEIGIHRLQTFEIAMDDFRERIDASDRDTRELLEEIAAVRSQNDMLAADMDTAYCRLEVAEARTENVEQDSSSHVPRQLLPRTRSLDAQDIQGRSSWPLCPAQRRSNRTEEICHERPRRLNLRKPPWIPPEDDDTKPDESNHDAWQEMGSRGYVMRRIEAFANADGSRRSSPHGSRSNLMRSGSDTLLRSESGSIDGGTLRLANEEAGSSIACVVNSPANSNMPAQYLKDYKQAIEDLRLEHRKEAAALWDGLAELAENIGIEGVRFIAEVDPALPGAKTTTCQSSLLASAGPAPASSEPGLENREGIGDLSSTSRLLARTLAEAAASGDSDQEQQEGNGAFSNLPILEDGMHDQDDAEALTTSTVSVSMTPRSNTAQLENQAEAGQCPRE